MPGPEEAPPSMSDVLRALVLVAGLLLACLAPAGADTAPDPLAPEAPADAAPLNPLQPMDTSSPSATYQSLMSGSRALGIAFKAYLEHKTLDGAETLLADMNRLRQLLDLDPLPRATRFKVGALAIGYLADILERLPQVPAAQIPGAAGRDWGTLPDKWRIPGTEITIAKVKEGPRAGEYLFSADTVEQLEDFHSRIIGQPPLRPVLFANWHMEQVNFTGPVFSDYWLRRLPAPLLRNVLDTPLWKVLLSFALVVAVFAVVRLWAALARRLARRAGAASRLGWRLSVPVLFLITYFAAVVFIRSQVNLSGAFAIGEGYFTAIVLYCAGAWTAWLGCFFLAEAVIASPRIPDHSYDAHLLRLAARLAAAISAAIILVYGANAIGIPALGLVAGLGIGGFAVALASKSSVENLFGGIAIFADRPFRVGDYIDYGPVGGGWVEAIGSRSCRIRALDGTLITVPNGELANMPLRNITRRTRSLFDHDIGLRYETSPAQVEALIGAIRDRLAAHPMVEQAPGFPRVVVTDFASSAINVHVRVYVLTAELSVFLAVQHELLLDIMRLVGAAGTGFAFPSQTTYLARDPGIDTALRDRFDAAAPAPDGPG